MTKRPEPGTIGGCPVDERTHPDGCSHSITHLRDGEVVCSYCLRALPPTPPGP